MFFLIGQLIADIEWQLWLWFNKQTIQSFILESQIVDGRAIGSYLHVETEDFIELWNKIVHST